MRYQREYGHVPDGSVENEMMEVMSFDLAAGAAQAVDVGARRVWGFIVSVTQGELDLYLGNFASGGLPRVPHWHFTPIGRPVEFRIPRGKYTFTVAAGSSGPLLGTLTPLGG